VAAGRAHTCALEWFGASDDGGDLYCWGDNAEGQVGDGTTTSRTSPVKVATEIRQVATGDDHTCVIETDQTVACWGRNDVGQLGTGAAGASESTAQPVTGLGDVIDLAAGGDTTCAVDEAGDTWCWGSDADGQIGDGAAGTGSAASPVKVDTSQEFTQVELGRGHACAVTERGATWCWGSDDHGQLGDNAATADTDVPVRAALPPSVDAWSVSAGGDSTCVVTTLGLSMCWGDNAEGQLGVGDRNDRHVPAKVDQSAMPESPFLAGLGIKGSRIYQISVGTRHACAVDISANAFCWGDNSDGQLGDGTNDDHLVPEATALVPGAPTALKVRSGNQRLAVTWKAPADLGAGALTGYGVLAVSRDGGSDCLVRATRCTISGLTNGTDYTVSAATITDGGLAFSPAVSGLPLGPASAKPVPGQGGQLPITGPAVSLLIMIGGGLVAIGLVLLRRRRRRA
jgi:LPXTG-motif cell wall-anchored protein